MNGNLGKILLLFSLLVLLVSCGSRVPGKIVNADIRLALMVKRADIKWFRMQIKGFEDTCRKHGIQYLILDNKMDSNLTLTNIDTLIGRKVDGVAIAVTEQKMSWIVVNRIFEAGLPIISLNYKLIDKQGRQLAPHIGIDYSAAGLAAGSWLAEKIINHSFFSNPRITPGIAELNSQSIMEINTWTDTVKKRLLSTIKGLHTDSFYRVNSPANDAAGGMLAMQGLLSTHPEVTNWIIYAGSSDEMTGALRALDQVGMRDYSYTLSIEYGPSYNDTEHSQSLRQTAVFVNTYRQGEQAAELLFKYIKYRTPIPPITLSSYDLVP